MIGISDGGMRLGSFGGISSGTSKSVGDLLFTKDGTTYVIIKNISGVLV